MALDFLFSLSFVFSLKPCTNALAIFTLHHVLTLHSRQKGTRLFLWCLFSQVEHWSEPFLHSSHRGSHPWQGWSIPNYKLRPHDVWPFLSAMLSAVSQKAHLEPQVVGKFIDRRLAQALSIPVSPADMSKEVIFIM